MFGRALRSLRVDGLRASLKYAWALLFGTDCRYLFVQPVHPPATPVTLPVEVNDVVVRQMIARDRDDLSVRRHEPRDVGRLVLGLVATRQDRIVGAAWYTDFVTPERDWYRVVEPHLVSPAWYDSKNFVVPGEKAAAWALAKVGTAVVGAAGTRCMVAVVGVDNAPSILLLRLLGARIVARWTVRRRFGYRSSTVEPVAEDGVAAVSPGASQRFDKRDS